MTASQASGGRATTRCLIADDQAMVREGFAAVLTAQPGLLVVGQAADGAEAVRQAQQLQPDIILMDVRMPVMDGLAATRQILGTATSPATSTATSPARSTATSPARSTATSPARPRVLILTTFDLDDYVYAALRAGASGFLLKDATAAELVHAVRVVAAGDALLAPSVTRRLIADFARQPRRDPPFPAALGTLTQRETEVLRLIAHGLSNSEISATLVIAEQTTKTHVGRILAKLNLRDRAQAVVLAYETGLVTPSGKLPEIAEGWRHDTPHPADARHAARSDTPRPTARQDQRRRASLASAASLATRASLAGPGTGVRNPSWGRFMRHAGVKVLIQRLQFTVGDSDITSGNGSANSART